MSPKRIRCDCGRVYDPAKHEQCPDCGTPRPQLVAAEPPKPPLPPPVTRPGVPEDQTAPPPVLKVPPAMTMRHLIWGAALVIGLIVILLILKSRGPRTEIAKLDHKGTATPAPVASATPAASATARVTTPAPTSTASAVVMLPPHKKPTLTPTPFAIARTPTPPPSVIQVQFDLAKAIAQAASGGTVRIPAGVYRGGFVVTQPLHLLADGKGRGPVVIQSEGKEGLAVEAKDVSVSGVQFVTQGIGQLSAIAVSPGAELTLDGCKLNSDSNLGATVAQGALLKTVNTSFTAPKGAAVGLEPNAKGSFTQTSFQNSLIGLRLTNGASAELHGCAFEKNGMNDSEGASVMLSGDKTQLTAVDCYFVNNNGGINVSDGARLDLKNSSFKSNAGSSRGVSGLLVVSQGGVAGLMNDQFQSNRAGVLVTRGGKLEMEKCSFDQNGFAQTRGVVAGSLPLSVGGEGSNAVVRQSTFTRSAPYAASVIDAGQLTLEDSEISGSSEVGLLVGDRSAPGGHAEIKNSHFLGNAIGLGICAGGSAAADSSEFRENNDGIVVLDLKSDLRLTKSKMLKNRRQGLHVFVQATAHVSDCDLRDNVQGALSGTIGKGSERAAITLENCRFGQNHIFGAGAGRESELVLNSCTFDGTDKKNVYSDHGAKVTVNGPPGESPSPSPDEGPNEKRPRHHATPRPHAPTLEDVRRTLRKFLPGGG